MMPTFKRAGVRDLTVLTEMRDEFQRLDPFPHPLSSAVNEAVLKRLLKNYTFGVIWLIEETGTTVGYAVVTFGYSLEYAGRDALLDELYLREGFRGQGIGTQVIEMIENYCRLNEIQALHLEVEHENTAAQKLYHKRGFENHDRYFLTKWIE